MLSLITPHFPQQPGRFESQHHLLSPISIGLVQFVECGMRIWDIMNQPFNPAFPGITFDGLKIKQFYLLVYNPVMTPYP